MADRAAVDTGSDDPEFVDRLARALDDREAGRPPDLRAICGDRIDLLPELEAALAEIEHLPGLHRAANSHDPLVGTVVGGRYALRERIGSGGMGVVYRAEDQELRRAVAVKMLRPELMSGDELEARLAREAEVLASLRHPAVVTVFDRGRGEDGRAWLVMSLLHGMTASELLEACPERAPPESRSAPTVGTAWLRQTLGRDASLDASYVRQAVTWIAEVARGLHVVHEAGVVHRDVKPSNVFVQSDGRPVLIDFGIVTLGPDTTLAMRDVALGTPAYMAPEQLDPRVAVTPAVDVYGLTATLYHLLTFERPFSGTPSEVLAALQRSEPTPAHRLRPGLPRDLQAILDKGMAREPRQRYATSKALADDLDAWLDYRPVSARPISPIGRVWRRTRRTPVFKTLVAVAVLAIGALAVNAWLQERESTRADAELELWATVGPSLLNGPPGLRSPVGERPDREIRALLDDLVRIGSGSCPSRVIRAGYLADRGELRAAAADVRVVADEYGSPTCAALATRYAGLAASGDDVGTLGLDDLPAPQTDVDRFVLAFHLLRESDPELERALELLEGLERPAFGSDELALLAFEQATLAVGSRPARLDRFRDAYDRAIRLEEVRGRPTAVTAQCIAIALLGQSRFAEARDVLQRGVSLAPFDFALQVNLGSAAELVGDLPRAKRTLEAALELQPRSIRAHELLAKVAIGLGDFDAAQRWIAAIPYADDPASGRKRSKLEGLVLLRRAIDALGGQDADSATGESASQLAEAAYSRLDAARDPGSDAVSYEMVLCAAVVTANPDYLPSLAGYLVRDPLNWQRLREFVSLVPEDLDPAATEAVRTVFHALIRALAPDRETDSK